MLTFVGYAQREYGTESDKTGWVVTVSTNNQGSFERLDIEQTWEKRRWTVSQVIGGKTSA